MSANEYRPTDQPGQAGVRSTGVPPVPPEHRRDACATQAAPAGLRWPLRRLVQALCLGLYAALLLQVVPWLAAVMPVQAFLMLDPTVSLSAAVAARTFVWALAWMGAVLVLTVLAPRAFCGYACPLGTLQDVFDWLLGPWTNRRAGRRRSKWTQLRFFILAGALASAAVGVPLAGYLAPIPILTRAATALLSFSGPQAAGPADGAALSAVALAAAVLLAGLVRPRLWCRYLCPSGAAFSLVGLVRLTERKIDARCVHCDRCARVCPFEAVHPDHSTAVLGCASCRTCRRACPTGAISFARRGFGRHGLFAKPCSSAGGISTNSAKATPVPPVGLSRRSFLSGTLTGAVCGAVAAVGIKVGGSALAQTGFQGGVMPAVRPPGAVPEERFLALCVRCGQCVKVCPTGLLRPAGLGQGLSGLWAPRAQADAGGCQAACNRCGQVCPTGAIRRLPLQEKRAARMGLAVVNRRTCLPHSLRQDCLLCRAECEAAGYGAVEVLRVGVETDQAGQPVEDSGFMAPVVLEDRCVGCGLCQARCRKANALESGLLSGPAITVAAGAGREDRLAAGSYVELRRQREQARRASQPKGGSYLPEFLK